MFINPDFTFPSWNKLMKLIRRRNPNSYFVFVFCVNSSVDDLRQRRTSDCKLSTLDFGKADDEWAGKSQFYPRLPWLRLGNQEEYDPEIVFGLHLSIWLLDLGRQREPEIRVIQNTSLNILRVYAPKKLVGLLISTTKWNPLSCK